MLGELMIRFLKKAFHWIFYRIYIRQPKAVALCTFELPTRPAQDLYTAVPLWTARIPNVVYQTWLSPSFGRTHRSALAEFRHRNSDFSFQFFSDAEIEDFMAKSFLNHPIYPVYKNALFGPLKIDIWRYCLLYERGGVYCDIGKAIKKPLRELIAPDAAAVISWERRNVSPFPVSPTVAARLQHPDKRIINWAMMFAPKHPILKRVIDGIAERYPTVRSVRMDNPKEAILRFTGPLWLTECVVASAEADELQDVTQLGIEFDDAAEWELPGSYVRYIGQPAYALARDQPIVA